MKRLLRFLVPYVAALALVAFFAPGAVYAQDKPAVALPTAPGAQKAVEGGPSQAPASLPGSGASPLEPYLVTWLLPVSGLLCAIIAVGVDKRVRMSAGRL